MFSRALAIEQEYVDLLERNLSPSDVEELKEKLGRTYTERQDTQTSLVADLRSDLAYKTNELKRLQQSAASPPSRPHVNGASPTTNGVNSKSLQQQISDFDS
jgi:hypothetical protein